jgi:hypothetical protein
VVFDETTANAPDSSQVSDLFGSAQAALRQRFGDGATLSGPSPESSSVTTGPDVFVGGFRGNFAATAVTESVTVGPAVILVGRDQSVVMFIPSGCTNTNTNGHFQTFVDDVFHKSDTNNATYAFAATPAASPEVPGGLIVGGCLNADATASGKTLGPAKLGREQNAQRSLFKGARLRSRKGIDSYCALGGGSFRIGYPTKRLLRGAVDKLKRKIEGRVALILTSSNRFSVAGVRPGEGEQSARRKLARARRQKVGRNTWYVLRTGSAELLVKAQGGKIGEVGIGDKRLTTGGKTKAAKRKALRRFLTGWQAL